VPVRTIVRRIAVAVFVPLRSVVKVGMAGLSQRKDAGSTFETKGAGTSVVGQM